MKGWTRLIATGEQFTHKRSRKSRKCGCAAQAEAMEVQAERAMVYTTAV
jgi:hypothetical protein